MVFWDPFRGIRVGEAKNPGPTCTENLVTFAILNPTVLTERQQDIIDLNADVISLAETSATTSIQAEFTKFLKTTNYRIAWGPPVGPQKLSVNPSNMDNSRRGEALGTASMHRIPHRPSRNALPGHLQDTLRVSQQVILLGHFEVLLITAYFFAGRTSDVRTKNDTLLAEIFLHCTSTNMPFVIAADFNCSVRDLPAYQAFQAIRCKEAFQFAQQHFDRELPPTYRNATRNDSFIFHESVIPWIRDLWVGPDATFPDHRPLFVQFNVPGTQSVARNWFIPASWGDIPLDLQILDHAYTHSPQRYNHTSSVESHSDIDDAFQRWSKGVEHAIRTCTRLQHQQDPLRFPHPTLPQKYFGRCQPTKFVTHTAPKTAKHDPTNGYNPPTEATSNKARLKARQTRRLSSLIRHIRKRQPGLTCSHDDAQLTHEWAVIQRAQGYGKSWSSWLLGYECIAYIPCRLPSLEWLLDAYQVTKCDADAFAHQETQLRKHHRRHCLAFAQSHTNNSAAYRFIKGKEQRFLTDIPVRHESFANLCRAGHSAPKIRLQSPFQVPVGARVLFGSCEAVVANVNLPYITLRQVQGTLPGCANFSYSTHAYTCDAMSPHFHQFWSQFWRRDSFESQMNDEAWSSVLDDLTETIPQQPTLEIRFDDPQRLWDSIHRLKPHKAPGVDGWHAEEFQSLTPAMVEDLSDLLQTIWPLGLSPHLMQARTLLFAKCDKPKSISDGRPITILGYIARLCSKLIADQILHQWASLWPPEISGGLPGRSARDLCVMQQLQIEHARTHHTAWGGWTMDLVKAFNLIPRRVVRHLFAILGIPNHICDFWFLSLTRLTRSLQCGCALGAAEPSTTGLPEGDSMSVVGMLALSFAFFIKVRTPQVHPFAYADNWSFMSTSERATFQAMQKLLNFVADLRMQIDFNKSWCWATTKPFKTFWTHASALLFVPGFQFRIKSHVHDLGCTISYTNAVVLGPLRDKIDNAVAKCNRLRKLQLTLDERAEKIQVAIWPAVFYGALGVSIGQKHFTTLRRAASNVLVGDHKHAASAIALHYISDKVQDPLLYILTDMLTTLRRFFAYHPIMASQILHTIHTFDGKVRGPASAIASYLAHCGWELTKNATLLGPGGLRVNLQTSSNKHIKHQLRISWDWFCQGEVAHRKGSPDIPFDSYTTIQLLKKLTDRQRRILALSITSGWQSFGAIAQWSATQDPKCPWCTKYDSHKHQLLECEAFHHIRTQHTHAVQFMEQNPRICWFPLPLHHPQVTLARQAMFLRVNTVSIPTPPPDTTDLILYTDGSCDDTRDPYTARAAWAVVASTQDQHDPLLRLYTVLASGHCPGPQTINRAELFALITAVEQSVHIAATQTILFVTDSQYAVNTVDHILDGTVFRSPHKTAHWDLVSRLAEVWDASRFQIHKIKSHMSLQEATSLAEARHIQGNGYADEVAGKSRQLDDPEFSALCQQIRAHRHTEITSFTKVFEYLLAFACARMEKLEKDSESIKSAAGRMAPPLRNAATTYSQTLHKLQTWDCSPPFFAMPPEPHRVVFWSCPWGVNLARMVWHFCTNLKWPSTECPVSNHDPGITWTELACSFMLWSAKVLPVRIRTDQTQCVVPFHDPRVAVLPIRARSVRMLADNFRLIVKHIQTFSRTHIIPQYKKQGASSLTRLGFTPYHEGGVSRRPVLPNTQATCAFLDAMILHMPNNPPYHTEIPLPELPSDESSFPWPDWEEVPMPKREKFLQNVRNAHFRKKSFDTIPHPNN